MIYNVGSKLQIRPNLKEGEAVPFGVTYQMEEMAGQICTIERIQGNTIFLKEDERKYSWHKSMFVKQQIDKDKAFKMLVNKQINNKQYEELIKEV